MTSPSTLPKDVGLCAACQTPNSKAATKCRSCSDILPWAAKKGSRTAVPSPAPVPPTPTANPNWSPTSPPPTPPPGVPYKPKPAALEFLENIHWGGTITFLVMFLGVMIISFCWPFWGFKMYRYFSDDENTLSNAAGAGLCLLFLAIMGSFWMYAPSNHTASP